jgi:Protein of unknown function (DUF3617)
VRHIWMIGVVTWACVPFAALASDSVHLVVGSWHERIRTISATADGKPIDPAPFDGSRNTCITTEQAANPSLYFIHKDGPECDAKGTVANGTISFTGTCRMDSFETSFTMKGQYGPTSYAMSAVAVSGSDGKTVQTKQVIDGQYVGPCPAKATPTTAD